MEAKLIEVLNALPDFIKNTHLNINLEGWPAAVTAIAFCCAGVAICAMSTSNLSEAPVT